VIEEGRDLHKRLSGAQSDDVALCLNALAVAQNARGDVTAAAEAAGQALAIWRDLLDPGDSRLGSVLNNAGSYALKSGDTARAEMMLSEALQIREAALADQPGHPHRKNTASWLIPALLVLARSGDEAEALTARARDLARRYGFDWDERVKNAKQFPDPTDQPPT